MKFEDFKKLSQEDAFKAAAEFTGLPVAVLDGLWRTESGRGQAMLSSAGAEGHFQIMPKTRALFEKRFGHSINPQDFNESLFLAAHHLRDDLVREKGDVANALRSYNNGPNWRSQADPRGENAAYAQKVLGDDFGRNPLPRNLTALAASEQTIKTPNFVPPGITIDPATQGIWEKQASNQQQEAKELAEWGFGSAAKRVMVTQGITGAAIRALARPDFEPDPNYTPDAKTVSDLVLAKGWGDDETAILGGVRSEAEFKSRVWELEQQDEDNRYIGRKGTAWALAAGLVGGLPEGALTGIGFGKVLASAGYGASQAARAGQVGRAVALSTAENVAGNVLASGVEDLMTQRVGAADYWMGAAIGVAATPLSLPGLRGDYLAGVKEGKIKAVLDEYRQREAELLGKARNNLGQDADPAALVKEVERIEKAEVEAAVTGAVGVEPSRKFNTDIDKMLEEEKAAEAKATGAQDSEEIPTAETVEVGEVEGELFKKIGPGVTRDASLIPEHVQAADAITSLVNQFLPDVAVLVRTGNGIGNGRIRRANTLTTNEFVIELSGDLDPTRAIMVGVHEVGHAIDFRFRQSASPAMRAGIEAAYQRMLGALESGDIATAMAMRRRNTAAAEATGGADYIRPPRNWTPEYVASQQEFMAEQFAKFIEDEIRRGKESVDFTGPVRERLKAFIRSILELFVSAGGKGFLGPEPELRDFFKAVLSGEVDATPSLGGMTSGQVATVSAFDLQAGKPQAWLLQDPIAIKYGLDKLPASTPLERAEAKAMIELYKKADDPQAVWNNLDPKALDRWFKNDVFDSVKSTSLRMLQSENPIIRMVAAELLESPSGAAGRRSTASIKKFMLERKFMGRVQLDFDQAYTEYRNAVGGGVIDDHINQETIRQFNKLVAIEIESRASGSTVQSHPAVVKAAGALEAAYTRMANAQKESKTIGWAGLPETSRGYMPHRMSAEAVRNMTREQEDVLYNALVDQFIQIEGWDATFSDKLATKYIDRVRRRGLGGYDTRTGVAQTGAADVVEDALKAMGMTQEEIRENMQRYMRGAAGHTKRRIRLDLLQEYTAKDGSTFRLIDFFETDQINLLRQQAQRVSGEVALTDYGIMGRPGMLLIKRAAEFGYPDKGRVGGNADEIDAFDQVMAEFLGDPFGNHQSRNLDRVMMFTTLTRLGGVVWNQIAETINLATTLGVGHALKGVASMPRLIGEIRDMVAGKKVNGVLSGLETWGYAPGLDHYRMNFPYESHTGQNTVLGFDAMTSTDRLLRSGLNAQAKLTGWRLISAVQERAASEQIVLKALRYIRDGGEDRALADMGITPSVAAAIKSEFKHIVTQDADGKFTSFDIQKMQNTVAAEDFVQAVHRGAKQIIQGTYIGETGKYAHDGWLKLLTQFKTFSIVSVEKQWGRNVTNYGLVKALAILVGSMSAAAPIYMARMYAQSVGRDDQEKFLKERLRPEMIARATLNYVASSGLAGELLDALSSISGVGQVTGGRAGAETGFVGSVVAPAAGVVDDVWKSIQNSRDGTNVHAVAKNLPFANAPFLVPVMNLLRDTD